MLVRVVRGTAIVVTGLMAGAFCYGAINLAPTFWEVPLQMRLTFHAELMKMNSPVMQTAMLLSAVSSLALAFLSRGRRRLLAACAGALAVATFLITRFGNVPINGRIKEWAVTSPPADVVDQLQRWDFFNRMRTTTAVVALILLVITALMASREGDDPAEESGAAADGEREESAVR
ncbi:anthrone oxygenase family protein [Streptomyces marokkonensis]|uniref:Anthrone oxygenase family protein n=1 Tax=Streptomyces marokkonensis TaxID=324855 RepID=A0ABW6QEP1_9ACTN